MNSRRMVRCWLLSAMTALTVTASAQSQMNELALRSMMSGPKPAYPAALQSEKTTGVAVAAVLVNPDGRVGTVIVLDVPHPLIRDAVETALMRWTRRARNTDPAVWSAKLTFYFQIRNGVGVVLNPDEMPGARRPEPRAGGDPQIVEAGGGSGPTIGPAELQRLGGDAFVLDLRDRDAFRRGHRTGAVNIPIDEVYVRGPIELPRSKTIVIDCSATEEAFCGVVGEDLTQNKFRVAVFKP